MVKEVAQARIPTKYGDFQMKAFTNDIDDKEHFALVMGEINPEVPTLVRVHSECLTGDVFHSLRCDCGDQLSAALKRISDNGNGVLLYMRQEGRGIGIINKLKAYSYQDEGMDTVEANRKLGYDADLRDYGIGAQILTSLGIKKISLMTNNPRKIVGLEGYGLEIVERIPIVIDSNPHNEKYLFTKLDKLGHYLNKSD
jgi:3,4-dihydroxy 2-butanone 4-phosphate synthase/GTP cyclohydrolase II